MSPGDAARTQAYALGPPTAPPCLFLHGLTGSPAELRFLAEAVAAAGFFAMAPLLPGHGLGAADLLSAGADDWLRAARAALLDCAGPAHVVGLSMGSLLGLRLASEQPAQVRSLALLAPAVRLTGLGRPASALLYRFPALYRRWPSLPAAPVSDLRDPTLAATNPKNDRLSLRALAELRGLQNRVFAAARAVQVPALVVLGARDRTISNRLARALAGHLRAELFVAKRSGHQVGLDYDRETVAQVLLRHLRRSQPGAAPVTGPAPFSDPPPPRLR